MGVFDNVGDVPGQLSSEALQVVLKFEPSVPAAGQGTISWNIPVPEGSGTLAYAGIVIVVSSKPLDSYNIPRDGLAFTADPTLDPDKFSGDKLNNARVIGYVYEADLKAQGKTLTTSIVVNDVDLNKNYYIGGYICDDQRRYDQSGSRAYSDKLGRPNQPSGPATQTVLVNFNPTKYTSGVLPTDGTGLVAGATYQFQLIYDWGFPHGKNTLKNMLISFDGSVAGTYGDMVKEINKQIAIQSGNGTFVSPVAPGAGIYYWDGSKLWQWDGQQLVEVPNVIVQATDPSIVPIGTYWYNPTTNVLTQWNGTIWVPVNVISFATDPTNPPPGTYWFDGTNTFSRCGSTWCEDTTITSTTDPSCPPTPVDCAFWFDTANSTLYTYGNGQWNQTYAVTWPTPPNALAPGTHWYDLTNNTLYTRVASGAITFVGSLAGGVGYSNGTYTGVPLTGGTGTGAQATVTVAGNVVTSVVITAAGTGYTVNDVLSALNTSIGTTGSGFAVTVKTINWAVQPFVSSTTDPFLVPANGIVAGSLWYNPTTEELAVRNVTNTAWTFTAVLVWPTDPTDVASCSLWFDDSVSSPGILKQWDIVNSTWNLATPYYSQATDPYTTPTLAVGTIWYNPTTKVFSVWTGNNWQVISPIVSPTDPTVPAVGTAWHDTTHNTWFVWGTPTPGVWNPITPVVSTTPPNMLPVGQLWFNTSIPNTLNQWNGSTWVNVPFTTTAPVLKKWQNWYNNTTGKLYQWTGTQWQITLPLIVLRFDTMGNLVFETVGVGSNQVVLIPIPQYINYMASGLMMVGTGAADFSNLLFNPYGGGSTGLFDIPFVYSGNIAGLDYFGDFSGNIGNGIGALDSWVNYLGPGQNAPVPYRALPIPASAFLWSNLKPSANILVPAHGQDGVSGTPSYNELGVGTDGSPDERRQIMKRNRMQLGYPTVTVELTDSQLDLGVQNALETFRQRSSMSVKRACFFLDIKPYNQHYILSNKAVNYNKIVTVMAGYRFTSAFLSSAMGSGVYGQVVMQHLYNMGTFDLLSYHLVSSYVEQLELLFATRLTFTWDESSRELRFHQSFTRPERVLLDVTLEKTEQEIFLDRYAKRWIQQFALAESMDMLAQVRGKYANLPGASGSVTLNAQDLRTQAKEIRDALYQELDDLIVQDVESYGAYGSIAIG